MARLVDDIYQLLSHSVNAAAAMTKQTHPPRDSHRTALPQLTLVTIYVHFSSVCSIFSSYSTPFNRKPKRK